MLVGVENDCGYCMCVLRFSYWYFKSTRWRSVGAPASQSVDLGFIFHCRVIPKGYKKPRASLLDVRHLKGDRAEQVGKLACCVFGQGTYREVLCRRQVAQCSLRREGWWQEGHPTVKTKMPANGRLLLWQSQTRN